MTPTNMRTSGKRAGPESASALRQRTLMRRTLLRLAATYFLPFVLVVAYFLFQSSRLVRQSRELRLRSIAEYQGRTLELFLRERVVNLRNLIYRPDLRFPPDHAEMGEYLGVLQRASDAFVDVGFFDSTGTQLAYAGPFPSLEQRNYSGEPWFQTLQTRPDTFVITDLYLGFRRKPHFTIGVNRRVNGRLAVMRATLAPERIYDYITTLEGAESVATAIVNARGDYQVVASPMGTALDSSRIVPPRHPPQGLRRIRIDGQTVPYAYMWIPTADWALLVRWTGSDGAGYNLGLDWTALAVSLLVVLAGAGVIYYRARRVVRLEEEREQARAQLEHAAKLASVGELAGGIAHEINNPLAVISEEAGLMKDLLSPEYGGNLTPDQIAAHLDVITDAVYRCRDITRNLLDFVRKSEARLVPVNINAVVDEVLRGLLSRQMAVSNIDIVRDFDPDLPPTETDPNQLKQVLLNIINNAVDALEGKAGSIRIETSHDPESIYIAVTDTGKGMTREQMSMVFMPFYTTKPVGKGTGLGLSVSYGIIRSLGGRILVDSVVGRGSTFTVALPRSAGPTLAPAPKTIGSSKNE